MQAIAVDPDLAGRLRSAQHQRGEQGDRFGRNRQHARDVLRVAHHATAAGLDDERELPQVVDGGLHVRVACLDHRIAAGLLRAAGDERVQRQRVSVGHGLLLLDEDAENTGFEKRQGGQRHAES